MVDEQNQNNVDNKLSPSENEKLDGEVSADGVIENTEANAVKSNETETETETETSVNESVLDSFSAGAGSPPENSAIGEGNANEDEELFFVTPLNRKRKAKVKPYDLKSKHSVAPERFAGLEIVNERFARQFRVGLFNRIRRNIDVIAHPIKQQSFQAFSEEATSRHLNLVNLHPLRGVCLFSFSPELISVIVSNLFGSEGRFPPPKLENREFTLTEQQVIKRILQLLLSVYQTAWGSIYQVETEYVSSEMQIRFTNITNSVDDIVLTSEFTAEIDGVDCGFSICIPYDSVEPIKDKLVTPPAIEQSSHTDTEWRSSLTTGIRHSSVELVANFAKINSTVNKVLSLKINDILTIDKPNYLDVSIGDVPVLTGQFGKSNKQYAIQVENLIGAGLDQINEEVLNDRKHRNRR